MKLKELLYNIIDLNFDVDIKGVTCNPSKIDKNYLFICLGGHEEYLTNIIFNSAAVIVDFFISDKYKTLIFHPDPRGIYTKIISRFYKFKQPKHVAAVTGTDGKTSVVEFCRQIWKNAGYNSASIGTLGTCISNYRKDNGLTTPDADKLYKILVELNSKNINYLALEASSHGIDQFRIHGLRLTVAAFTNFSQDHLDYHKNINTYFETKKKLFEIILPKGKVVVLNSDIFEYYKLLNLAKNCKNNIITYGKKIFSNICLISQTPTKIGQNLIIKIGDKIYKTFFPVIGKFQAHNLLCAIGITISSGIKYEDMYINKLTSPPGRMEKIASFIFIDYAHTPFALKQSILSLKWHFKKKIILVFGCGGNRDQIKRAKMGKIAQTYADKIIITDDNPRNEDPAKIRHDILKHCPSALEISNRIDAINKAIDIIIHNKDMILLIAGKGHEEYKIINNKNFLFNSNYQDYKKYFKF